MFVCVCIYTTEPGMVAKAVKVKAEHPDVFAFLLEARSDVSFFIHTPSSGFEKNGRLESTAV